MKFTLAYPIKPRHVNQPFGNVMPLYLAMGMKGHNGIDFYGPHGTPVYAAHDGNAYWSNDGSKGCGVVLVTRETFDYNGGQAKFKTIYWHFVDPADEPRFMSPIYGNGVVAVKKGDLLGYSGNTGISTGAHLHFGLKAGEPNEPDPQFIRLDSKNGYFGAIDPQPYFDGTFAKDSTTAPQLSGIHQFIHTLILSVDYGTTSGTVKRLQQMLIDTGFPIPAGPTGFYGPQTKKAVDSWLRKYYP